MGCRVWHSTRPQNSPNERIQDGCVMEVLAFFLILQGLILLMGLCTFGVPRGVIITKLVIELLHRESESLSIQQHIGLRNTIASY